MLNQAQATRLGTQIKTSTVKSLSLAFMNLLQAQETQVEGALVGAAKINSSPLGVCTY